MPLNGPESARLTYVLAPVWSRRNSSPLCSNSPCRAFAHCLFLIGGRLHPKHCPESYAFLCPVSLCLLIVSLESTVAHAACVASTGRCGCASLKHTAHAMWHPWLGMAVPYWRALWPTLPVWHPLLCMALPHWRAPWPVLPVWHPWLRVAVPHWRAPWPMLPVWHLLSGVAVTPMSLMWTPCLRSFPLIKKDRNINK